MRAQNSLSAQCELVDWLSSNIRHNDEKLLLQFDTFDADVNSDANTFDLLLKYLLLTITQVKRRYSAELVLVKDYF